jgi:hypothetical protein
MLPALLERCRALAAAQPDRRQAPETRKRRLAPRGNVSCQDESAQVRHADLGKVVSGDPEGLVGSPAAWRAVAWSV